MSETNEKADYVDCIVSFIDVLGFRSLLHEKSAEDIRDILNLFREVSAEDEYGKGLKIGYFETHSRVKVEIVSDAIVRVRTIGRVSDGALFSELQSLARIQILCLMKGVFIRGAVTIGQMHTGSEFSGPIFGPALVDAYEMEEREVVFPRIALHENLIERFRSDQRLWSNRNDFATEVKYLDEALAEDESSLIYLDYLRYSRMSFGGVRSRDWKELLHQHKASIVGNHEKSRSASVRRKYQWLAKYHNRQILSELQWLKKETETEYGNSDLVRWFSGCLIDELAAGYRTRSND